MLQRLSLILFLICLLNEGCKQAPEITICISSPSQGAFSCYDQRTKQSFQLPYSNSDKFVAFPPADAQTLLNFCAQGK